MSAGASAPAVAKYLFPICRLAGRVFFACRFRYLAHPNTVQTLNLCLRLVARFRVYLITQRQIVA